MSKHTPGPWTATRNSAYWQIDARDFGQIGDACASGVWNYEGCPRTQEQAEAYAAANARLMAAAPELLGALEALEEAAAILTGGFGVVRGRGSEDADYYTHEPQHEKYILEIIKEARAAIAKARGEPA